MSDNPCPKCGAATEDIGSKLVCGECYWVFDKYGPAPKKGKVVDVPTPQRPQSAPVLSKDPKAPLPIISQAAPVAQDPTKCPKCSGETTDVGSGRLVCGDCYWVIEPTKAPVGKAKSSFAPTATEEGEEGALSGKAVGGMVLIIMLILMIVILAIRH